MSKAPVTPYDASPEVSPAAIRAFDGSRLPDLDEALYLRKSTEDFIGCARPGLAAAMLMKRLDWLRDRARPNRTP